MRLVLQCGNVRIYSRNRKEGERTVVERVTYVRICVVKVCFSEAQRAKEPGWILHLHELVLLKRFVLGRSRPHRGMEIGSCIADIFSS